MVESDSDSFPPAPQWKDAFGSIIISINYDKALFKNYAWPSQAAGAELSPWPFAPWLVIEQRSGSRPEGLTGLFIFLKNHCLASAIHVSSSIPLLGNLQEWLRRFICMLALLEPCLTGTWFYFLSISFAKKENSLYYKEQKHNGKSPGGWRLTDKQDIRNKTADKGPVFLRGSFWLPVHTWKLLCWGNYPK